MLSLELIDAGLVLAQQGSGAASVTTSVLHEVPGIAVLEEAETLTGNEAAPRIRLKPLIARF